MKKKVRRVLVDLGAVKSGGGAQRATNFLDILLERSKDDLEIALVVPSGNFGKYIIDENFVKIIEVPNNFLVRTLFELTILRFYLFRLRPDLIYTFVGSGLGRIRTAPSLVGVAYPIVCYPDSPYWSYLSLKRKVRQKVKNYFRRSRLEKADVIIVQTPVMKERVMQSLKNFDGDFRILPPAVSNYVYPVNRPADNNILLLSGNEPHKNLWRLYEVAEKLKSKNFKVKFLLTVDSGAWLRSLGRSDVDPSLVTEYFEFVGRVDATQISGVYDQAKVLLQLSDLESFSNNYSEAWKAGLPLIVSDRDFARGICGDSAIYVEPHDPAGVADAIIGLLEDGDKQNELIESGKYQLAMLPTQDEYFDTVLQLIDEFANA